MAAVETLAADDCDTPGGVRDLPVTAVFAVVRDCGGRGSCNAGGAAVPSAGGASAEGLREVVRQQAAEIRGLREENALLRAQADLLREQNAQLAGVSDELRELVGSQAARLAEVNETLAVLQRMVFGRSSEKVRARACRAVTAPR